MEAIIGKLNEIQKKKESTDKQLQEKLAQLNELRSTETDKTIGNLDIEIVEAENIDANWTQLLVRLLPEHVCEPNPEHTVNLSAGNKYNARFTFEGLTVREDVVVRLTVHAGEAEVVCVDVAVDDAFQASSSRRLEQWVALKAEAEDNGAAAADTAAAAGPRLLLRAALTPTEKERVSAEVLELTLLAGELEEQLRQGRAMIEKLMAQAQAQQRMQQQQQQAAQQQAAEAGAGAEEAQARSSAPSKAARASSSSSSSSSGGGGGGAGGGSSGGARAPTAPPAPAEAGGVLGYLRGAYDLNVRNPMVRGKNLWMLKNVAVFALGVFAFHYRGEQFAV